MDIINRWCDYNFAEPKTANDIAYKVLWYNSYIKADKKLLYYRKCTTGDDQKW